MCSGYLSKGAVAAAVLWSVNSEEVEYYMAELSLVQNMTVYYIIIYIPNRIDYRIHENENENLVLWGRVD